MDRFKRPKFASRKRREAAKTAITATRIIGMASGISATIAGWVLLVRGKPTPLVHAVHFSNVGNFVGMMIESQISLPPEKVEQLHEWVDEALKKINEGELLEFVEFDGDKPLFKFRRISSLDHENVDEGLEETLILDVEFHADVNQDISGEDLAIAREQMSEALLVTAFIDHAAPEFEFKFRIPGSDELLSAEEMYGELLVAIGKIPGNSPRTFEVPTVQHPHEAFEALGQRAVR